MIALGVCQEASFVWVVRFAFVVAANGVFPPRSFHPRLENNSVTGNSFTITTILAVLAAGVHVPIVGSSDSAAKKEDRKEDGAPPVAEEQA